MRALELPAAPCAARSVFTLLAAATVALTLPGPAAAQKLTLHKAPAHAAVVTDDVGALYCGLACGTVTATYPRCTMGPEGGEPVCSTPGAMLVAARQPGWALTWSGCDGVHDDVCHVTLKTDRTVTAQLVDVQSPDVFMSTPSAPGVRVRGTYTVVASASDNDVVRALVFYADDEEVDRVDFTHPEPEGIASAHLDTTVLPDGPVRIGVKAIDASEASRIVEREIFVDNTAPALAFTSGPQDGARIAGSSASFAWEVSDASGFGVECKVDGVAADVCPYPTSMEVTGLTEGAHTFAVVAADQLGNRREITRTFTVDLSAPDTAIVDGPPEATAATSATFRIVASESGATFGCRLHAAGAVPPAFAPCEPVHSVSGLAPGDFVFEAVATDGAGHVDQTPARRTFRVVPPAGGASPEPGPDREQGPSSTEVPVVAPPVTATLARAFRVTRAGTRVRGLALSGVSPGASVSVACRGRGCPFVSRTLAPSGGAVALTRAFARARLRPRAVIEIRVTLGEATGRLFRIATRRGRRPSVTTLCLPGGAGAPAPCS